VQAERKHIHPLVKRRHDRSFNHLRWDQRSIRATAAPTSENLKQTSQQPPQVLAVQCGNAFAWVKSAFAWMMSD
jgi:hypothetical protein